MHFLKLKKQTASEKWNISAEIGEDEELKAIVSGRLTG